MTISMLLKEFTTVVSKAAHAVTGWVFAALLASVLSVPAHAQMLEPKDLFNWAEASFPTLFPGKPADQVVGPYVLRFYSETQTYLGVTNGEVYALGPPTGGQLVRLNTLAAFQCQVFPARCTAPVADIASTGLAYGKSAIFTMTGSGVSVVGLKIARTSWCTDYKNILMDDTRLISFSCTVSGSGPLAVQLQDANGVVLLAKTFTVPHPQVRLQTTLGDMVFELYPASAPVSVRNYLQYVDGGFYTGTLFHRVIPSFVVQAGGYTTGLAFKAPTFASIALESNNGLKNARGTLAMARMNDPNTANTQFYLNLVNNTGLDYTSTFPGYAVFGAVVSGFNVMDAIAAVPTSTQNGAMNVPVADVVILGAQRVP
jgi:peptidyl-prolyl cis-trans isomerase A (cyclophilin A)